MTYPTLRAALRDKLDIGFRWTDAQFIEQEFHSELIQSWRVDEKPDDVIDRFNNPVSMEAERLFSKIALASAYRQEESNLTEMLQKYWWLQLEETIDTELAYAREDEITDRRAAERDFKWDARHDEVAA